jgi:hypothetical protein
MKPTIGRIVLVTIGTDNGVATVRPAVVVRVWDDITLNLQLLLDGSNDDRHVVGRFCQEGGNTHLWLTSVTQGDGIGQWNWPPRV